MKEEALLGLARLMKMAYQGTDLNSLGEELVKRAAQNDANALLDLSILLQLRLQPEIGLEVQKEALKVRTLYHLPAENPGIRLLALMSTGNTMANTPLEFLVENSDISLDLLYLGAGFPLPEALPSHDVAFVAVGETESNQPLLALLAEIIPSWPRPVLNRPECIAKLSRDRSAEILQGAPGIEIPLTARMGRVALERAAATDAALPYAFPLIIRPLDSHAGKGLEKVDNPAMLTDYLARIEREEYFLSSFCDYKSPDGYYRKYRIVMIDGRAYASHMGISTHWMIHYMNADMEASAQKRAMEEEFMANFDRDFAPRHQKAIESLQSRIGLDYLVVDCAQTPEGKLLIFELDSGAVVHAMDSADIFPYKGPQMRKVFAAFRAMLEKARHA